MGERGRAVDTTGFSKANLVNSSTVSWSRSVDSITFAKSLKLSASSQMFYHVSPS